MKALVTEGCGFVGSHACEHYTGNIGKGAEVTAYDNVTKHESLRTGYATEAC